MDYPNNNKCKSQTLNNNKDDSEDGDIDELGNSQHLESRCIICKGNTIVCIVIYRRPMCIFGIIVL